jgi:argininosuccinate synthase
MVDVAKEVGADAVAHGCTGKGNDQACLTSYYYAYSTMSCQLYYSPDRFYL